jgi:hypothetical protein
MQHTERLRYYAQIYLWSLLGSVTLGAAFGRFNAPMAGVWVRFAFARLSGPARRKPIVHQVLRMPPLNLI